MIRLKLHCNEEIAKPQLMVHFFQIRNFKMLESCLLEFILLGFEIL